MLFWNPKSFERYLTNKTSTLSVGINAIDGAAGVENVYISQM
jgi:hypothetical protein